MRNTTRRRRALDSRYADFEAAATVTLAATASVTWCAPAESASDTLSRHADFDCLPVVERSRLVGVLRRTAVAARARLVGDAMEPVEPSMVVGPAEPLLPVFESMTRQRDFRLVLAQDVLLGILTPSDMNKLPARALIFCRITHVELLLAAWIGSRVENEACWLSTLPRTRQRKTRKKHASLSRTRDNLDLMAATDFTDKRIAATKLGLLAGPSKTRTNKLLERIQHLRDDLVHADSAYAEPQRLSETARLLVEMRVLIQSLRGKLPVEV